MEMKSLQGQLLIASPKLVDPNFFRSVVLLVQHNDGGALGLVLNRPLEMTVQAAWEQVEEDIPCLVEGHLHQGGPCEGPLMVLHTDENLGEVEVVDGIQFSAQKESVEQLVAQNEGQMKFFVGYAGWGPGQLENEMSEGAWLALPASTEQVFDEDEEVWQSLYQQVARSYLPPGVNPKTMPEDPSNN